MIRHDAQNPFMPPIFHSNKITINHQKGTCANMMKESALLVSRSHLFENKKITHRHDRFPGASPLVFLPPTHTSLPRSNVVNVTFSNWLLLLVVVLLLLLLPVLSVVLVLALHPLNCLENLSSLVDGEDGDNGDGVGWYLMGL